MKALILFIIFSTILITYIVNCSFQTKIFSLLNENYNGKNLILSPYSIFQVLSLKSNGANGKTQEAMLKTLGVDDIVSLNDINYDLLNIIGKFTSVQVANAVMTKVTTLPDFTDIANKYLSTVEPLESLEQVNGWCNRTTHGKIPKILDKLDDDLKMILLRDV